MTDETATPAPIEAPAATSVPVTPAAPADASLIAPAAQEAAPAPARPEALPESYWDPEAGTVKPEAFSRLAELEAAEAARRQGVPEAADKYELKLVEDIKAPDGTPLTFAADDPLAAAILPVAHELGLPQESLSKLLTAYAKAEMAGAAEDAAALKAAREAEIGKLGPNAETVAQRTGAIHSQIVAAIGPERAESLRQVMTSADAFMAIEALVAQARGPNISAAPPATQDQPVESRWFPSMKKTG